MAEQEPQHDARASKGGRFKTILVVGSLLAVEAVVFIGLMMVVGGEPQSASAEGVTAPETDEGEKIVEVQVLDAKLPNAKTGITYLYNTEIWVQVKQKDADRVAEELDRFSNEIRAEIGAIWRTSEPAHFREPRLENLTRKVHALLNERFGVNDDGEPILTKCVIVMGTGFRVD
jgi:hypothetical protein